MDPMRFLWNSAYAVTLVTVGVVMLPVSMFVVGVGTLVLVRASLVRWLRAR